MSRLHDQTLVKCRLLCAAGFLQLTLVSGVLLVRTQGAPSIKMKLMIYFAQVSVNPPAESLAYVRMH
jgi:hypothetical protein